MCDIQILEGVQKGVERTVRRGESGGQGGQGVGDASGGMWRYLSVSRDTTELTCQLKTQNDSNSIIKFLRAYFTRVLSWLQASNSHRSQNLAFSLC